MNNNAYSNTLLAGYTQLGRLYKFHSKREYVHVDGNADLHRGPQYKCLQPSAVQLGDGPVNAYGSTCPPRISGRSAPLEILEHSA